MPELVGKPNGELDARNIGRSETRQCPQESIHGDGHLASRPVREGLLNANFFMSQQVGNALARIAATKSQ